MGGRGIAAKALGLTCLAALLRLYHLADWGYGIDEASALYLIHHLGDELLPRVYPLSYLFQRGMVELLGTGEGALRLLPALLGIASVPLLYLLYRRPAGERAAAWGALLLALSPWHLFWSQSASDGTLQLAIALLLFRLAWDWWEEGGRIRLAGIAALGFLGLLTHLALILAWPALMVYPLLARRAGCRQDRRFAWNRITLFKLVLLLPILLALGRVLAIGGDLAEILGRSGLHAMNLLGGLVLGLGLPLCLALLLGTIAGLRSQDRLRRRFTLFLAAAGITPTLFAGLAALFHVATTAAVFFALGFMLLLVTLGLDSSRETRHLALTAGAILAAFYLQGAVLYFSVHHGGRLRWREAVAHVREHRQGGDNIVSSGGEAVSYYLGEEPARLVGSRLQTEIKEMLTPELSNPTGPTWYILSDALVEDLDRGGRFRAFLRDRCHCHANYPLWCRLENLTVRVYYFEPEYSTSLS